MAAPPVKSQPLHNFSLPHLKWAHKTTAASSSQHHRLRRRDSPDQHRPECEPTNPKQQNESVCAEENGEAKPWKLRPRKEAAKKETVGPSNDCNINGVKSLRLRGEGGQQNGGGESKSKRKIWISLSREEIEEDVYALTGGKPARRPRKWPKNVQKHLDNVFPGLYLVGLAADSYRIMMLWYELNFLKQFRFLDIVEAVTCVMIVMYWVNSIFYSVRHRLSREIDDRSQFVNIS